MTMTDAAKMELLRFSREELADGEFIRIARAYQCGGPRFQLIVDDTESKLDERIVLDEVTLFVDSACHRLLKDVTIDFTDAGFSFHDADNLRC
ncbi:hypothetical protein AAC03nite_04080 [Alicyclobacillus acidoterrestris]|nr:hypothetical protein AAC03nite_04080 [Alicyclobacillus acidoterrestris]